MKLERLFWSALLAISLAAAGCGSSTDCTGASCVCTSGGDCELDCVADCSLQCAGAGTCDFICGADCDVACTGSGPCIVDVGDDSAVNCTGSGGCDVACHGDCNVSCPGSGVCIVRCEPGAICTIDRCEVVTSCPDGVAVCGGPCP